MKQKYTPGPWTATKFGIIWCIHPEASESEQFDICRVTPANYHPDGIEAANAECEATARLIAAAPDLLAALEAMMYQFEPSDPGADDGVSDCDAIILARAAIAKAKG